MEQETHSFLAQVKQTQTIAIYVFNSPSSKANQDQFLTSLNSEFSFSLTGY